MSEYVEASISHRAARAICVLLAAFAPACGKAMAEQMTPDGGSSSATPSGRPTVVWKDATGAVVPMVVTQPGEIGNSAFYFDGAGYVWRLNSGTGTVDVVGNVDLDSVLYSDPGCTTPAFIISQYGIPFPPRVTFRIGSGSSADPVVRVVQDGAQSMAPPSGLFSKAGPCRPATASSGMLGVPIGSTVPSTTLTPPTFSFKLPLHPEWQP